MIEIEKQVARYQELHKQASNGPWTWELGMSGQNWPICNVGAGDTGETYWVTTDNVRASEVNSSGPQVDAEFIALSRNLAQPLLDAWGLRKILIAKIVELNSHTQQWDDINDAVTSIKAQRDALAAENQKLAAQVEQWKELASQAEQAIYFTREYVGEHMLPAIAGWSWYDTSVAITQALVAQEPER